MAFELTRLGTRILVSAIIVLILAQRVRAESPVVSSSTEIAAFRLDPTYALAANIDETAADSASRSPSSKTPTSSSGAGEGYSLGGPYFLRSADPEEAGELEFKLEYGYETRAKGGDNTMTAEIEWGIAENHEFIFEVPLTLGEGTAEGNGDIELGFHNRLWKEDGWLPAFAIRNMLRVPTGYHSSGVEWVSRGLVTKTIIPDRMRLHANPWVKLNCRDEEDVRTVQWGTALGVDYRLTDALLLVADYQYSSGELEGTRDNHEMEIGADWKIAPHHTIGVATKLSLDGDDYGPHWGCYINYSFSFDFFAVDENR